MCNSQETCYQFLLAVYLISKQQRTSRTKPNYKNQASLSNLLFRPVSLLTLLFSLSCRSQTTLRSKLKILLLVIGIYRLKIEQVYVHVKTKSIMNPETTWSTRQAHHTPVGEHTTALLHAVQGAHSPADTPAPPLGLRIQNPQGINVPRESFSYLNMHKDVPAYSS